MNIRLALGPAAVLCLWVSASVEREIFAAEITPQKQSLTIPVTVKPPKFIKCTMDFGPAIPLSALAFSPDGKTLAVGGYQEVLIWDIPGAKLLKRIGSGTIGGMVRALAFLKDGKQLAVGEGIPYKSGVVRLFNIENGRQTHAFEEPEEVVCSLAISPDGKFLAAAGTEPAVRVWNIADKKLATTIKEHNDWVLDVSFSADSKQLATASADRTLKLWEVGTWATAGKLVLAEPVHGATFSTDGKYVFAAMGGPRRRGVEWHSAANAKQNRTRASRTFSMGAGTPLGVVMAPKGDKMYVPCSDKTVKVFDPRNGRTLATLAGHEDWVYSAALSSDGTKLASGSGDGTVKLWNTADNKLLATLVQLSPRADGWLILTPQGYLATSTPGALKWKTDKLETPVGEITKILQKPELVQKAIAGEKTEPPALK